MLTFVWMALEALGIMVVVTALMSGGVRWLKQTTPLTQAVPFMGGFVLLVGMFIFSLMETTTPGSLGFVAFMFGLLWLILSCRIRLRGKNQELYDLLICLVSVWFLPVSETVFPNAWSLLAYPILGVGLYLIMHLWMIMDRVPQLSIVTLLTQGVLIALMGRLGIFPEPLLMILFYGFVTVLTVAQVMKVFLGQAVLGSFAAPLTGFIMGYLWISCVARGFWSAPFILFGYDLMEVILAAGVAVWHTHRLALPNGSFLIERAMATGHDPKKLSRYLFFILLMLSFLGLLSLRDGVTTSVVIFWVLILGGCGVQLKQWGTSRPSFKDLGKDLKTGLFELKKQLKQVPEKAAPRKGGKRRQK